MSYNRLKYIIEQENLEVHTSQGDMDTLSDPQWAEACGLPLITYEEEALEYIAKQAQGGMRDAITTLDKCLQYNKELSLHNVVTVLSSGVTPYELFDFTDLLLKKDSKAALDKLNEFYMSGIDMNLFINMYFEFLLNCQKYLVTGVKDIANIPDDIINKLSRTMTPSIRDYTQKLFNVLNAPKMDIKVLMEAWVIERCI